MSTSRRTYRMLCRALFPCATLGVLLAGVLRLGLASGSGSRAPAAAAAAAELSPAAGGGTAAVEGLPDAARTFISGNCRRCHNGTKKVAGLDLTSLAYDPDDGSNFALWVKVHDRVMAGEMPP